MIWSFCFGAIGNLMMQIALYLTLLDFLFFFFPKSFHLFSLFMFMNLLIELLRVVELA